MKSIAICYGQHSIDVSDSHRSSPSIPPSAPSPAIPQTHQNAVTSIYRANPSSDAPPVLIRLKWTSSSLGFSISVIDFPFSAAKLRKSSRALVKKRGSRTFQSSGLKIEVYWDVSRAKYSGPEPVSGFQLTVTVNSRVCLALGDVESGSEVKKRVSQFSLVSRSEHFLGDSGGAYSTAAKFCESGSCHSITITWCGGMGSPVLSVFVDGKNVIEVKRLKWNFRGNQTMFIDGVSVDLMWDVHDWLFRPPDKLGYAVFMFRTRSGFDSRLWLEDKNLEQSGGVDKIGFSLLILARRNSD